MISSVLTISFLQFSSALISDTCSCQSVSLFLSLSFIFCLYIVLLSFLLFTFLCSDSLISVPPHLFNFSSFIVFSPPSSLLSSPLSIPPFLFSLLPPFHPHPFLSSLLSSSFPSILFYPLISLSCSLLRSFYFISFDLFLFFTQMIDTFATSFLNCCECIIS